jgi:hypothetical protein
VAGYLKERPPAFAAEIWLRVAETASARGLPAIERVAVTALGALPNGDPLAFLSPARVVAYVARSPALSSSVAAWFQSQSSPRDLDIERVKGLVFPSKTRAFALAVLGQQKLVKPLQLGLPWLLALAKRSDPELHRFAYRTLLEHTAPGDFATGRDQDAVGAGVARLFAMATAPGESDNTRQFAQTYLRCHHPLLGPADPQAKELGLAPQLQREDFTEARVWPALFDAREDVRRFAAAIARLEMRRWNAQGRLAKLADSDDKIVRTIALDAMLQAGQPSADPETTLRLHELDAATVFPLTESPKKTVRDVGMELIRRHYAHLGGVQKLSWLMQSAEREVRLFAVRLLWEKHRPRATPPGWQPRAAETAPSAAGPEALGAFTDGEAMRGFLRRVLFALPPGALGAGGDERVRKHVPASVAKRQLVEVVRDVALADASFAALVRPVLAEMTGSLARGEWQACLAALAAIDRAHPNHGQHSAGAA